MPKICIFLIFFMALPFGVNAADVKIDAKIASGAYVEKRLESTVSITGNQEVQGVKDFKASPIVPTPPLPTE